MSGGERIPLGEATALALYLKATLGQFCERIEIAGSVRRGMDDSPDVVDVGDIELIVISRMQQRQPSLFDDLAATKAPIDCLAEALDGMLARGQITRAPDGGGHTRWGPKHRRLGWPTSLGPSGVVPVDVWWGLETTWGWSMVLRTGPAEWAHRLVTRRSQGGWCPDDLKFEDGALWRYEGSRRLFVPTPDEPTLFREMGLVYQPPGERRDPVPAEARR